MDTGSGNLLYDGKGDSLVGGRVTLVVGHRKWELALRWPEGWGDRGGLSDTGGVQIQTQVLKKSPVATVL